MSNIEYKQIQTVLGNNWHVVVDDAWLFYPCSEDLEELKAFVDIYKTKLLKKDIVMRTWDLVSISVDMMATLKIV